MQSWLDYYSQQIRLGCATFDAMIDINEAWLEGCKRMTHCWMEVGDSTCRVLSPTAMFNQRPLLMPMIPPRGASWTDWYGRRTGDVNPERI